MHLYLPLGKSSAEFHDKEQLYGIDDFEISPCRYNRKGCSYLCVPHFLLGAASPS